MADGFGTTLGDKLGSFIAVDMANNPVKGPAITNQPEQIETAQTPDGETVRITIAANNVRDDLIKSWEQIGRKLIDFLASMNKGASTGFTLGLSTGEKIEYKPNSIKITVGTNTAEVGSSTIKASAGSASCELGSSSAILKFGSSAVEVGSSTVKASTSSASCELGSSSAELKFGSTSVKASATGVKISGTSIELN
jgi:hypothetical protein